jgi:RNA polymerase sigma-70 factor (ECF subfamily)
MDATKTRRATPGRQPGAAFEDRLSPEAGPEAAPPLSAEQVYYDYAPRVYNMARRMVRSDVDAEDVTQDVLLQVVRKLPTFRGESAFPTWLHRVTVNAALSHRRRQAVRQEHRLVNSLDACAEEPGPRRVLGPEAQVLSHETRQLIQQAIESLPPAYRAVFELADIEGRANADVAAHLGLSLAAVKSRLHRARLMLRDALAPHFTGNDSAG